MQICKDFLNERRVVKQFRVSSKSIPGDYYLIQVLGNGEIIHEPEHECIAVMMRKKCRHIRVVEKYLNKHEKKQAPKIHRRSSSLIKS